MPTLRVAVFFEFDGITDPDSPEASEIVAGITESCGAIRDAYEASAVYVDDAYIVKQEVA